MSACEKSTAPPQQLSPDEMLEKISELSSELDGIRKRQAWFTLFGVVLILGILAVFLLNLSGFGKNFSREKFSRELFSRMNDVAKDQEFIGISQDFRKNFLPEYAKCLRADLEKREPEIRHAVNDQNDALLNFMENELRSRMHNRLQTAFSGMEKRIVGKYGEKAPSPEQLSAALKETEDAVVSDTFNAIDSQMKEAKAALSDLHGSFEEFKNLPEYKNITALKQNELESKLLETFLELWIYRLNPERGDAMTTLSGGL